VNAASPDHRSVLVTGCSSGFGLLAAVSFARRGCRVYATMRDITSSSPLEEAAAAAGVNVRVVPLDVTSTASVEAAVATVLADGPLDVVVNNAGVELFGAVHLVADHEISRQLDTNVHGPVRVVRAVVPSMIANGGGTIVNVGSIAGLVGAPYSGLYAASKHALEAITEAMHFELAHLGVRVCIVEPGQFATELATKAMVAEAMPAGSVEHERWQAFRSAMRGLVDGEPVDPQLVADVVVDAALGDHWQLRWPVGADADLVIATKSTMSFDDFESTMRTALDWHD
jgi:NAD(P)-dependent dehydrogenase (short-subunit alcohol dehydrogenase family)